ncbi:MAG TPA: PEGA domain-containing protein [Polyangia bacterium]|nr:PEGA domain-containing protein [Polyangia bacterium]
MSTTLTSRPPRAYLVALSSFAALMATGPAARAADASSDRKNEARLHFDQGVQLFRDGDFQAAAIEFRRAYDTEPNFRVLYNIGQACAEAKDYACALTSFSAYLDQGGTEVAPARRAQLEQQMEKLRLRTGRLFVRSNVDGAAVLIDDVAVGRTPLSAALLVSAGRRKVAVVSPSGVQQLRTVEVAGGDQTTVDVPFQVAEYHSDTRLGPADVARDAPLEPESVRAGGDGSGRGPRIIVPAIVTGVLVAAAVFSGVEALRSKQDFDNAIGTVPGDHDTIENDRHRTRSWALATDLLTGAALVGGIFTALAIFRDGEGTHQAAAGTSLSVGPSGIAVMGRF